MAREQISEQATLQVNMYHTLLDRLQNVSDLSQTEHYALAFLVDAIAQEPATQRQHSFSTLLAEISPSSDAKDISSNTWKLAQAFHTRYEAFLVHETAQTSDPIRQKNLQILRTALLGDMKHRETLHQTGKRVPIGSVIFEHLPSWFSTVK